MKKFYILLSAILFIFNNESVFPQQTKIDSLQDMISHASGENKVDLLLELANESSTNNDVQAYLSLSGKIFELADSLDYEKGKCKSLFYIVCAKIRLNEYPSALSHCLLSYHLAEQMEDINLISESIVHLGDLYILLRKYDSALFYNEKALVLANNIMDTTSYLLLLSQKVKINLNMGKIKQSLPLINELDSLIICVNNVPRIEKINQVRAYFYYYFGNYTKAIEIFKLLKDHQAQNKDFNGLSVSCSYLGNVYYKLNQTDSAIHYHLLSISCKPQDLNVRGTAMSYNTLGAIYKDRNEYEKALENFHKSVEIKIQMEDTIGAAITHMNISTVYRAMINYDKAIEYNMKSLPVFLRNNLRKSISFVYHNLGNIFLDIGTGDSAVYYFHKALILKKELQDIRGVSYVCNGLGSYFYGFGQNTDSALYYYTLAYEGFKKLGITHGMAESQANLADCYYQLGSFQKAISAYVQSIPELEMERSYDNLVEIYKNLAASYYQTGSYKLSYEAQVVHQQLQDSIFNAESLQIIADMQEKYDSELKEKENLVLQQNLVLTKSENKVMRLYIWLLVVFLVLMVATIVFVSLFSRYKRRTVMLKLQLTEEEKEKIQAENKAREVEEKRLNQIIFAEKQISKLHQEKLEQSREKLHRTSLQIIKQNQRFISLRAKLKDKKGNGAENESSQDEIIRFINQSLNQEVDWMQFRNDFEQSYPGFLDQLSDSFSQLTERELQFLALTRTQLSSRQIADILCIEENSVKKDRSRIKKKMDIEPGTSLYDYLCS